MTSQSRPVSSLSFISKVMGKIVAARLSHHMQSHNLYKTDQSAYKKGHSTETALLRIHNDLLTAADSHRASCLVLLDLSAAFDTVDHNILLTRLSKNIRKYGLEYHMYADDTQLYIYFNTQESLNWRSAWMKLRNG